MDQRKDTQTGVNESATFAPTSTELAQWGSRTVLEQTRRDLIVMAAKQSDSPIGHRCYNLVELLKLKNPPAQLVARQMADLQRLLAQ